MVKIEAETLESAYSLAAKKLSCSITQLNIEVVQIPKNGFLGMFKKQAIIVATCKVVEQTPPPKPQREVVQKSEVKEVVKSEPKKREEPKLREEPKQREEPKKREAPKQKKQERAKPSKPESSAHRDIILPQSFVTDQEEDDYDGSEIYADEDDEFYSGEEIEPCNRTHDEIHAHLENAYSPSSATKQPIDNFFEECCKPSEVATEIKEKVEALFKHACFEIDEIKVCEYDEKTILVEFTGKDAALLIGKEGYRYKALSYMLFNWINATYQLQLRLEIAEFLKNQEEMICKYLEGVYTNIDRDGRAQTKILDGVLVQIALRELRAAYPEKYVAIRSTRDKAKFIIINSFNNNDNNNNNA